MYCILKWAFTVIILASENCIGNQCKLHCRPVKNFYQGRLSLSSFSFLSPVVIFNMSDRRWCIFNILEDARQIPTKLFCLMSQELEHSELELLAVCCDYQKLTNLVQVKWAVWWTELRFDTSFGEKYLWSSRSVKSVNSKCFCSRIGAVIVF